MNGAGPRHSKWRLDPSQCVGCGICADVCGEGALVMGPADLAPTYLDERCTACGRCAEECPTGAIVVSVERGSTLGASSH